MRKRIWIVFALLVLILLAISALSGLLNHWLDGAAAPRPTPSPGTMPEERSDAARLASCPVMAAPPGQGESGWELKPRQERLSLLRTGCPEICLEREETASG